MAAVRSLTDLVIFELVRCKYKNSRLPAMISNIAYKKRKFGEYATEEENDILNHTISRICEHWMIPGKLSYLKNRIVIYFSGLVLEILNYAAELADSITQYNPKRIELCVDSIVLTQTGKINKAKTVLAILKNTEFLLEFNPGNLFHNFVLKQDLIEATNDVLNSLKNPDTKRAAKIKTSIEKALEYKYDYTFIAKEYFADQVQPINVKYAAGALLLNKDHEGVRKVCDLMNFDNRQKFLIQNQKWLLNDNSCPDGEMIKYLSLNLPKEEWKDAIKNHFQTMFHCLFVDWRSREFSISLFLDAKDIIDLEIMQFILNFGSNIYEEQDNMQDRISVKERIKVLKSIWVKTPLPLRHDIKQKFLKSIHAIYLNANFLKFIIESYSVSDQGEIICELMKKMDGKSKRFSASDYENIFSIYLSHESKLEGQSLVDENIVTTFKDEMNVLKAKKRKN